MGCAVVGRGRKKTRDVTLRTDFRKRHSLRGQLQGIHDLEVYFYVCYYQFRYCIIDVSLSEPAGVRFVYHAPLWCSKYACGYATPIFRRDSRDGSTGGILGRETEVTSSGVIEIIIKKNTMSLFSLR